MKIQYLHHSAFRISTPKANILIDPYVNCENGTQQKPLTQCPIKKKEFKNIHLVLITHEHCDHFDKKFIETLVKNENSVVVGHESVLNELKIPGNLKCPIALNQKLTLRGLDIEAKPVHHPLSFYPLSFLVSNNGSSLYHSGDTDLISQFEDINADVCLLPIGGTQTMDIVDAIKATKMMKPNYTIPMHYNTFDHIKADPQEFKQKIKKSILKSDPVVLEKGEVFSF